MREWLDVSRRPQGVTVRQWLPFLRARLTCLARGHDDHRMLHRQLPAGARTRLEVKQVCGRCGEEFESRSAQAQFPRRREQGQWRP